MAKKHNADYWNERFAALENSQYITSEAYCKDLRRQFSKATVKMQADIDTWYQRIAKNNGVSYAEAKKLLDQNQLKEFHWTVDEYIKYGKENGINQKWIKELENASAKVHISRLEAMKLQVRQHAEKLFAEYESGTSKLLNKTFSSGYYKTAFEIAKGTGVGSNLHRIDTRKIDTFIRQPWAQDGANFSDRIWKNKAKLMNTLHTELSQSIIRGADQRVAIDHISRIMDVSKSAAETLVRTECAAITSEATKQCYKDLNLEKYEILATLDSRTSDICQDMDGKVFDMKDYEVGVTAPPFHPRCRTTTVPYYEDESTEGEERAARDEITGKTYYVPADMTYHEWEKKCVNDNVVRDKLGIITNNNKSNPRYYNFKGKTLFMVEKEISQFGYEVAVAFDKNGKAVFCQIQTGKEHEIGFTKYQLLKMKGLDLTHNHPVNTPLSPEDLYLLKKYKLNSMRACGIKGAYVIKYDKSIEKLPDYEIFNRDYECISDQYMSEYLSKAQRGEFTMEEAEIALQERTWKDLCLKYKINMIFEDRR